MSHKHTVTQIGHTAIYLVFSKRAYCNEKIISSNTDNNFKRDNVFENVLLCATFFCLKLQI